MWAIPSSADGHFYYDLSGLVLNFMDAKSITNVDGKHGAKIFELIFQMLSTNLTSGHVLNDDLTNINKSKSKSKDDNR